MALPARGSHRDRGSAPPCLQAPRAVHRDRRARPLAPDRDDARERRSPRRAARRRRWEFARARWRRPRAAGAGRCRPCSAPRRRCGRLRDGWRSRAPAPPPIAIAPPRRARAGRARRSAPRDRPWPRSALVLPDAVEQAHDAFDDEKVAFDRGAAHKSVEQRGRHGPAVEIDALPPRRRRVEGRVDIIGPGLGRLHGEPAAAQGASRASVTVVLPAPDRGAATIRAGAVMTHALRS